MSDSTLTDAEYDEAYKAGYADGFDACRRRVVDGLEMDDSSVGYRLAEQVVKEEKEKS